MLHGDVESRFCDPPGPGYTYRHVHETVVEDGAGEVQPLVHLGSLLEVLRVQAVAWAVRADEVGDDGMTGTAGSSWCGGFSTDQRVRVTMADLLSSRAERHCSHPFHIADMTLLAGRMQIRSCCRHKSRTRGERVPDRACGLHLTYPTGRSRHRRSTGFYAGTRPRGQGRRGEHLHF